MASIEKKLSQFHEIVLKSANDKKEEMVQDVKEEMRQKKEQEELDVLEKAYQYIQSELSRLSKEKNNKVLSERVGMKKALLLRREEMIAEIFELVGQKLEAFKKTPEYQAYLENIIGDSLRYLEEEESIVIYLDPSDEAYRDAVQQKFSSCQVETAEKEIVGGVIVKGMKQGKLIDYSMKDAIESQREGFLAMSGLSIL